MYGELAEWWPLISAPEEYVEEAGFVADLLDRHAPGPEVLELGSGGGNMAWHLARRGALLTLVDLSDEMLAVSRRLNPLCEHRQGDMRAVRLDRTFDAVFAHDAVAYLLSEDDLRAMAETAFVHCRPGGLVILEPDDTTESYQPSTDHGGNDGTDGRAVRYLEWWDAPAPGSSVVRVDYVFVLRQPGRPDRVVHDVHHNGLFSRDVWLGTLRAAGFDPWPVTEVTAEDRRPRELFLGRRPA
jgi:SAM-dependent methyltransferase